MHNYNNLLYILLIVQYFKKKYTDTITPIISYYNIQSLY